MITLLRVLLYWIAVKPFVALVLGVQVKGLSNLPRKGPAILVANHNSHLDTLVLLSLFPFRQLNRVHPVAAGDYFLKGRFRRWFALNIVRVIPIDRKPTHEHGHPLSGCRSALDRGEILALFPEGSRGRPEQLAPFKQGVAHLVADRPEVPVIAVYLSGTGKVLPRGEALLVPHICKLSIGEPFRGNTDRKAFMRELARRFAQLAQQDSSTTPQPTGERHDPQ
jgi:1-acyl-sn-glycerol-3-phosphate acyltransferase